LVNVQTNDSASYSILVSNEFGSTPTEEAIVRVYEPVNITENPESKGVLVGSEVRWAVSATGSAPISYQWYLNDSKIIGATNSNHHLTNTQPSHAGKYVVRVSNPYGFTNSVPANLTVWRGALAPSTFAAADYVAGAGFSATIMVESNRYYRIQTSTNLWEWSTLTNLVSTNSRIIFFDREALTLPRRFYRMVSP
jgi:hypothetical protein